MAFADFLRESPAAERTGPVFNPLNVQTGRRVVPATAGNRISDIGEIQRIACMTSNEMSTKSSEKRPPSSARKASSSCRKSDSSR